MNSLNDIPVEHYTNYDLDYLKFQISKNCTSLDLAIDKLRNITQNCSEKDLM